MEDIGRFFALVATRSTGAGRNVAHDGRSRGRWRSTPREASRVGTLGFVDPEAYSAPHEFLSELDRRCSVTVEQRDSEEGR